MLRYLIIIGLTGSLLLVGRLSLQTASVDPLPPAPAADKVAAVKARGEKVRFYPDVPDPLPELTSRYVFNEERHLAVAGKEDGAGKVQVATDGLRVNMDELYYSGSVIIGDSRQALVSFTELVDKGKKRRTKKSKNKGKSSSARKYARLKVDETLGVYLVTAIETHRIVFSRGTEEIVKTLYDNSKKRLAPPVIKAPPRASKVKKVNRKVKRATKKPPKIAKLPMQPRPGK